MTLGEYLRHARDAAGLTREHVAEAVGWRHPNSVGHIERGSTDVPRETLSRLLTVLGVPESEWADVMRLPRESHRATDAEPDADLQGAS